MQITLSFFNKTVSVEIPDGYSIVTQGSLKEGDLIFNKDKEIFVVPVFHDYNDSVKNFYKVIRLSGSRSSFSDYWDSVVDGFEGQDLNLLKSVSEMAWNAAIDRASDCEKSEINSLRV